MILLSPALGIRFSYHRYTLAFMAPIYVLSRIMTYDDVFVVDKSTMIDA